MRINLKNAVSFDIQDERNCGMTNLNGFNKETFRVCENTGAKILKSHIVVDFGNFSRTIWFKDTFLRDNFVSEFLPSEINGIITE